MFLQKTKLDFQHFVGASCVRKHGIRLQEIRLLLKSGENVLQKSQVKSFEVKISD